MRELAQRWTVPAAMLLAALSLALLVARSWRIDYSYSIDFQVYWLAGARVAGGEADALYEAGGGPDGGVPLEMAPFEFKNLPIVAAGFAPFARLDYLSAKRVYWWIGAGGIGVSAAILGWFVLPVALGGPAARAAWALALLCLMAPTHTALRHGQTTPLVLLALCAYLAASLRERSVVAGCSLALACLVKLPLIALGALDVLRSRVRTVAAWTTTLAAIVAVSLVVFGAGLHRQYLAGLGVHAGTVMAGHNNQSVAAVATRLSGDVPVYDWEPRPLSTGAFAATVVVTLLLLGLLAFGLAKRPEPARAGTDGTSRMLEFSAVLAIGIVVLPVAWDHYFLLLAPGLVTLARGLGTRGLLARPVIFGSLIGALACVALPTPQWALDRAANAGWPGALLVSHYFLGALLMLGLAVAGLRAQTEHAGGP